MRAAVAAVLALALAGCVESRCDLGWDGVSVSGPPCTVSGNSYASLYLAGQRPDGTWWTPFCLRMPDGRILAHDEITPATVGPYDLMARISGRADRKSTRLNSSHSQTSYAVFCLKKKK